VQHPDELRLSSRQIAEWIAYDQVEPVSLGIRIDAGAAMVAHVLANINRDSKKRSRPFTLDEFLMRWDAEEAQAVAEAQAPRPEDLLAKATGWAMLGVGEIQVEEIQEGTAA